MVAYDVGGLRTRLVDMFTVLKDTVLPEFSTALTTAKDELLAFFTGEQSLAELGTGIQAAFASIDFDKIRTDMIAAIGLDQISWDFTNVNWTTVGTDIRTGVTNAVNKIEWFAGQTATFALKLWASVTAKFNAIDWSAIGTGLETVINGIISGVTGTEFDLTDKVETLKTNIKTSVTNAINKVQFWAEETPAFVTNFANEVKVGITSSISNIDWSAVRTSLKTGVENAINGIEWFTGKVQLYTLKLWANVTSAFQTASTGQRSRRISSPLSIRC